MIRKTRFHPELCRMLPALIMAVALASADAAAAGAAAGTGALPPGKRIVLSFDPVTGIAETEFKYDPIDPKFLRPLVKIEKGRNDSNPAWSPRGTFVTFERSVGDKREIRIAYADGTPLQTVSQRTGDDGGDMKFLFPGMAEEASYNAGITWAPDELRFIFMSNGGEGNYDLYLQYLGGADARKLTDHKEKDGQAHWSATADRIVLVSGRTGNGDVYLLALPHRPLIRLTRGGSAYLYPRWSPNGRMIAMMHGSNENHDIILMRDVAKSRESVKALTTWEFDDLRPVWSPDGSKIAFYSNYNAAGDPRVWSILVIAADGSDPTEGPGLAAKVVAADVIPDVEVGPAWMPDSSRIVFVKNDRLEYNPLYVADIRTRAVIPIRTDTKMNHDVACSVDGTIAFRAQVDQWDQIFIMKLQD